MSGSRCGSTSGIATSSTPWRSAIWRSSSSCCGFSPSSWCRRALPSPSSSTSSAGCRSTGGAGSPASPSSAGCNSGRQYQLGLLAEEVDNPDGRIAEDIRVVDRIRRRVRPEHPAMRPAALHLPERAVGPVGNTADQAGRLRIRPPGLHGVGRRGLRPGRLVAHLCAGPRPDPCRQRPPGPRGRFPLGPDPGARTCRRHRPDARRGRRARAAARLAVRPALGLACPDARSGQPVAAHQLARLSGAHRAADRGAAALPWPAKSSSAA